MLRGSLRVATLGSEQDAVMLAEADNDVDTIYENIIRYLGALSQERLVASQPQELEDFVGIANYLENIGDVIEKDLLVVARKRQRKHLVISRETMDKLEALAAEVCRAFEDALVTIKTGESDKALDVLESKAPVFDLAEEASTQIVDRLVADAPNRMATFEIETDIIEIYRRLNTLTRRIARLSVHGDRRRRRASEAKRAETIR